MKKHLKGLVLTAGLLSLALAGCGSDQSTEEIKKNKPLPEADYPSAISEKADEFHAELLDTMTELSKEDDIDKERESYFKKQADKLDGLSVEVIAIEPPSSYKEVDQIFEESMMEFRIWLDGYNEALETKEYTLFAENLDHTSKGTELYEEAKARLSTAGSAGSDANSAVTPADLNGTLWAIEGEAPDYRAMGFEEGGTAWYSFITDVSEGTYRGSWVLDGNTVVLQINEATENDGTAMKNPPEKMEFEIVSFAGEKMQIKQDEEFINYILVE